MKKTSAIVNYVVQSIKINTPPARAFAYVSNPKNLPAWTNAFKEADEVSALMVTPQGELKIALKTIAVAETGSIDWYMTMPYNAPAAAFSRIVPCDEGDHCIFSFVLLAPPVALEDLEGTLAQQSDILTHELQKLSSMLDASN